MPSSVFPKALNIFMSGSNPYDTAFVLSVDALVSVDAENSQLNAGSIIPTIPYPMNLPNTGANSFRRNLSLYAKYLSTM